MGSFPEDLSASYGVGHKPPRRDTPLGQFVIHPRSCHHEAGSTPCPKMLSASRADTYMSWAMFPLSNIWWNHKNPFPLCLIHLHVSSLTGLGALGLGSHHPGAHAFGVLGNRKCLGTGQARSPCLGTKKREGQGQVRRQEQPSWSAHCFFLQPPGEQEARTHSAGV